MKSLKEALLNRPKNIDVVSIAAEEHINTNYNIEDKLTFENVNGVCIVNCDGDVQVTNGTMSKLTEGFVWGEIRGDFNCSWCAELKSLEGAPETVGGFFDCSSCKNLKSLKGAPGYVGKDFFCDKCENLKSLEGAPKGCQIHCDSV